MKTLPVGIQDFNKLRKKDCLYVDKTDLIHQLICGGSYYFLSRPRRFGKSLLLSTLEEIFRGNKDLFEDLYFYDRIDWTEHPVIKIDWSNIKHTTPEEIEADLSDYLDTIAATYQVKLSLCGYMQAELEDSYAGYICRLADSNQVSRDEALQQSLMTCLVGSYADYPVSETAPMRERMLQQLFDGDSVWKWDERVVIAELKYSDNETCNALLDKAMAQIQANRYHERYAGCGRRIAFLAIAFAGKQIACRMEEMDVKNEK